MKYTVCYTKTYYVDIEADNAEDAIAQWEDMDLDSIEFEEPSPELQNVAWVEEGKHCSMYV